ncbi:hypothetical protein DVR12_07165 [Chitinophaga silvatica]|uniref:Transcriptional regulator, AbiEi antitoxin, Type IV TA system n=1 Tax=Chitinophaga silvatica TaxID=2282649 RepID=A0A3E1YEH2_9BACT|nr:DUF6088 family protein [Chitinophaga silvatica]RFS24960.1 hypothetical protein DVR12_07165 [Chitinophaga silvatica]
MESVKVKLYQSIKRKGRGNFVFIDDFIGRIEYDQLRIALSRLVKEQKLLRLGHGIYYYPEIDKNLGILYPSMEDIAYAIAANENITITPTRESALNKLGLSTQVPIHVVFLSNGPNKVVRIGSNKIIYKSISNKKVSRANSKLELIVSALETGESTNQLFSTLDNYSKKEIIKTARKINRKTSQLLTNYLNKRYDRVAQSA